MNYGHVSTKAQLAKCVLCTEGALTGKSRWTPWTEYQCWSKRLGIYNVRKPKYEGYQQRLGNNMEEKYINDQYLALLCVRAMTVRSSAFSQGSLMALPAGFPGAAGMNSQGSWDQTVSKKLWSSCLLLGAFAILHLLLKQLGLCLLLDFSI